MAKENYRKQYKDDNPYFEKITKIVPMDLHHPVQQCEGGKEVKPMLEGRHEKHVHARAGKSRPILSAEDYLYEA